jgi:glutathione S-transferase
MTATPDALLSAIVTILALLFYFYAGINVGQMRGKHKIPAPLMSGHPEFDRAFRVHMNTLEQLVVFIPLLWIATRYFHMVPLLVPAVGLVWVIGRVLYMQGYMAAPEKRSTGFLVGIIATAALLIMSVIGIVTAWGATTAA